MIRQIILFYCLLFFISYNGIAQNNNQKKIDSLTAAINQCLNCSIEYFERASLYLEEEKRMLAMSDLNKAIEIHLEYFDKNWTLTEYYKERGYLKSDLKDFRGAIQDFDKASEVNSGYATLWEEVLFGKAYCKSKVGDIQGAIKDYEKVFVHNPDDYMTHFNLGLLKIEIGRKDEGCLNLSKAGELGYIEAYELISEYCN